MNDYKELIELLAHPADGRDNADIMISAADAIEQLVKERDELYMEVMDCTKKIGCKAIEQVKKERDAAISQICQGCDNCKHRDTTGGEPCISCSTYRVDSYFINSKWEWRGVQE